MGRPELLRQPAVRCGDVVHGGAEAQGGPRVSHARGPLLAGPAVVAAAHGDYHRPGHPASGARLVRSGAGGLSRIPAPSTVASGSGQGGLVSWVLMLIRSDHVLFLFFSRVRVLLLLIVFGGGTPSERHTIIYSW